MDSTIAARLDKLTLTSKISPWQIFLYCFYSNAEVCQTTADCNGYFNCCFNWWSFHFHRGRLRFDGRPDIIIKVTQIINGVSTVIYMDPYTSTRSNVNNTHIDLFLDISRGACNTPKVSTQLCTCSTAEAPTLDCQQQLAKRWMQPMHLLVSTCLPASPAPVHLPSSYGQRRMYAMDETLSIIANKSRRLQSRNARLVRHAHPFFNLTTPRCVWYASGRFIKLSRN